MKRNAIVLIMLGIALSFTAPVYASDWGKFGKAVAVVEGLRVITGGRVDIVASLTGLNCDKRDHAHRSHYRCCPEKIWVPKKIVWKTKYVPQHIERAPNGKRRVVEGHYIKYKVEEGGYWKVCSCC